MDKLVKLEVMNLGGDLTELKKPLYLKIVYGIETDTYTLLNEELGLFAISDRFDKAIDIISEKFETLYDIYVTDTSMELTKDALKLREKLKEYL